MDKWQEVALAAMELPEYQRKMVVLAITASTIGNISLGNALEFVGNEVDVPAISEDGGLARHR